MADWVTVDTGAFAFRTTPDLVDQSARGIDSQVGRYESDAMTASFDYGWYSPDISELVGGGGESTPVTVDGFDATLVEADLTTVEGYERAWFVGLHVPAVGPRRFAELFAFVREQQCRRLTGRSSALP